MDNLIQNLCAVLGRERVVTDPHELFVYECDGLPQHKHPPRAVLFPTSTEEVSEVVRVLAREGAPFVARGAGTGLSGGAVALGRGIVIELARMRRLLHVDAENRTARVEVGMVNAQLSRALARYGLHYAPDPSSQAACTIGGNIAENAGGIHCLKYGTTVDHVLAARVVLADGQIVELGGDNGYDLLGVFVGSEGTFGVATQATVRLTPLPQAVRTLLADFTDIDDASRAVSAIIAAGHIPAALEMVDGATIHAVEASVFAAGLPLDAEAVLLVELDGLEAGIDDEAARVEALCRASGARGCRRAADEAERKKLWAARKGAFGAMGRLAPDVMIQDAVVPRSRLPELLAETYRIGAKYRLRLANVFHAGDGNLHPFISFDSRDADEERRVKEAGREIMETCVRAGGTITGEHGVGFDKSAYLPLIFSAETLDAMLDVRAAFDPSGLCNPGKIIPTPRGCGEARAVVASKGTGRNGEEEGREEGRGDGETGRRGDESRFRPDAQTHSPHVSPSPRLPVSPSNSLPVSTSPRLPVSSSVSSLAKFDTDAAWNQLASVSGAENVARGRVSSLEVAPGTVEEACELMRLAASEGWAVTPSGAGTWLDAGNSLTRADVVINTTRLDRIVEHVPADLVATAQAGVTLDALNARLMDAGQWLPLDPPGDACATLGGVAATGARGAQTLAYGPPRAHVLGMTVALAGGRLIRVGGRVVKNVAGYDLCKLFVGSHGALGLILDLTFKLRPRPQTQTTVAAFSHSPSTLFERGHALVRSNLQPSAVELLSPAVAVATGLNEEDAQHCLLVRFDGTREAVSWQTGEAVAALSSGADGVKVSRVEEDGAVWSKLRATTQRTSENVSLRLRVPPTALGELIGSTLAAYAPASAGAEWHAGVGDGRLRLMHRAPENEAEAVAAVEQFRREARRLGGSLVVERAPMWLKSKTDAWGIDPAQAELMKRIKSRLDPVGILSPGRF